MPTPSLRLDLFGLLAAQLGLELAAVGGQAALLGRVGLVLPAVGGAVGAWLWLRRRVEASGLRPGRLQRLAMGSSGAHMITGGLAYAAHALVVPAAYSSEPGALALGVVAMSLLAGLTAGGLTLCAGDAAGATGSQAPPSTGRQPDQPLSLADLGLGPPPDEARGR